MIKLIEIAKLRALKPKFNLPISDILERLSENDPGQVYQNTVQVASEIIQKQNVLSEKEKKYLFW